MQNRPKSTAKCKENNRCRLRIWVTFRLAEGCKKHINAKNLDEQMNESEIKSEINEFFKIWITAHEHLQTKKSEYEIKKDDEWRFVNMILEKQHRDEVKGYLDYIAFTMDTIDTSLWKIANPDTPKDE